MWMVAAVFAQTFSWNVVNDTVMGGVSTGSLSATAAGVRFTGRLSLEQNGGFVSVRSAPADLGWQDAAAVRVRVVGDGRTWTFNAYRSDVRIRAGSYRVALPTVAGEIVDVVLPLSDFDPTSFGRPVGGAPTLDARPGRIDQVGFLLADKRPGPYSLEILSVEAAAGRRARTGEMRPIASRLRRALAEGVPAFNAGDPERCRDAYREALLSIQADAALTDGEQRVVREALERSSREAAADAAWTLRGAIDTVLASS